MLEKKDLKPPFSARDAVRGDLSFITKTALTSRRRTYVTAERTEQDFESEMFGRREASAVFYRVRILEHDGEPVGYYEYHTPAKNDVIRVDAFEIIESVNWHDATASLLVDLRTLADGMKSVAGEQCEKIEFEVGSSHPAFNMFDSQFGSEKRGYAWVVRVPDVARLVSHLAPLIEGRLADSDLRGWTGDVRHSFYRSGLHLKFEEGKLVKAENTSSIERHEAEAHYPDLTFTKALFGQYSFSQLRDMYSDCFTHKPVHHVLQDILWGG